MVRVAGVHDQVDARIDARGPDGALAAADAERDRRAVTELDRRHAREFTEWIRPALAENGIRIVSCDAVRRAAELHRAPLPRADLPRADAARDRPRAAVPVHLEPVAQPDRAAARPRSRPRGVRPREGAQGGAAAVRRDLARTRFIPLEEIIARAPRRRCSPGMDIISYDMFRVTRDADFEVSDEADDLLEAVEDELRRRRFGEVVRLEVGAGMDSDAARPADRLAGRRRGPGLRRRRDARPRRPVADRRPRGPRATSVRRRGPRSPTPRSSPVRAIGTTSPTCSRRCGPATCSSTTRTSRSRPASSGSSSRPSTTPTCWRSR